ncbi:hypothetical protein BJ165DRAFT_1588455 [Panaeolus papilionaceus]|nr:hypothetical protein BJ165DRAFT_1588455 [Panaeolus papilionaceus]
MNPPAPTDEAIMRLAIFLKDRKTSPQSYARLLPLFLNPTGAPLTLAPGSLGATTSPFMNLSVTSCKGPGVDVRLHDITTNCEFEFMLFGSLVPLSSLPALATQVSEVDKMAVLDENVLRHPFELREPTNPNRLMKAAFNEQTSRVRTFVRTIGNLLADISDNANSSSFKGSRNIDVKKYGPPLLKWNVASEPEKRRFCDAPIINDNDDEWYPCDVLRDLNNDRQKSWKMYEVCRFLANNVDIIAQ